MPNRPDDLVVSVEPRNDGGVVLRTRAATTSWLSRFASSC